jgi:hypothetical protein
MLCYVVSREGKTGDGLIAEVRGAGWSASRAAGWLQLWGIKDTADDIVLAVAPVTSSDHTWLREAVGFRARFPRIGLVLVLDPVGLTPRQTRALSRVDALIPPVHHPKAVVGTLDAATVTGPLRELDVRAAALPEGTMRSALRALFLAPAPPGTVRALARCVLASGSTLSRTWPKARDLIGLPAGINLKGLIGVTVLTRAVADRRRGGGSWNEVAVRSSLDRETLRRWSRRVLSCDLDGCDRLKAREIAARIRRWLGLPPA